MSTYSEKVQAILENKGKKNKEGVLFDLIMSGEFKTPEAAKAALEHANVIKRGKAGRAGFYDWLREGGVIETERDLIALMDSGEVSFSENERKKSNYGHWMEIAKLVQDVRANNGGE